MKFTISMTASELIDSGLWDEYCTLTYTNEWAVNEGLMDGDESLQLPESMAERILERRRHDVC
jgi:hypothetical protein